MNDKNEIVAPGARIKAFLIDDQDQSYMTIRTDQGDVSFATEGDCCSETWFADLIGVENVLEQPVIRVEQLELPTPDDDRTRQEVDEAYGFAIITANGRCDVIYRNSSNGYYGGSIYRIDAVPGDRRLQLVTTDWQAPGNG